MNFLRHGAHRNLHSFPTRRSSDLVMGTLPLVREVVRAVAPIPVIAAGGIADGAGLAASLMLGAEGDRKSTRLNSSHVEISYAVFCLKKKKEMARGQQPIRQALA